MRNTLVLAVIAALAFASAADAKSCKDPTTHKFVKCPAAAAAPAKSAPMKAAAPAMASAAPAGKAPHCVKGKACGNSCIKMTDVCHK